MKKVLMFTFLIGLMAAGMTWADDPPWSVPPVPDPAVGGVGMVAHMSGDGTCTDYGELIGDGSWDYTTVPGVGTANWNVTGRNDYRTTDAGGVQTAMDDTQEWVLQVILQQGAYQQKRMMEFGSPSGDVLQLYQHASDQGWYAVGDTDLGEGQCWLDPIPPASGYFTLTLHYQPNHWLPDRTKALDIWINDDLAYAGLHAKNHVSDFDMRYLSFRGNADYDEITLGGVAPEPMTLVLLGLGGLTALRRKRS
jgi:hypothetical protein